MRQYLVQEIFTGDDSVNVDVALREEGLVVLTTQRQFSPSTRRIMGLSNRVASWAQRMYATKVSGATWWQTVKTRWRSAAPALSTARANTALPRERYDDVTGIPLL